jgi:hypothetical protein
MKKHTVDRVYSPIQDLCYVFAKNNIPVLVWGLKKIKKNPQLRWLATPSKYKMATSSIQANRFNFKACFMRILQAGDTLSRNSLPFSEPNCLSLYSQRHFTKCRRNVQRTNRSDACALMLNTDLFSWGMKSVATVMRFPYAQDLVLIDCIMKQLPSGNKRFLLYSGPFTWNPLLSQPIPMG